MRREEFRILGEGTASYDGPELLATVYSEGLANLIAMRLSEYYNHVTIESIKRNGGRR